MNSSPNNGRTSYNEQNVQTYSNAAGAGQRRPVQTAQGAGGRPMTDEERRRLAAARARMNNANGQSRPVSAGRTQGGQNGQRPMQSGQRPVQGGQRPVQGGGQRPMQNGQRPGNGQYMARKRRRRVKLNVGALIFVAVIALVLGVSLYRIAKSPEVVSGDDGKAQYESIISEAISNASAGVSGSATGAEESVIEEIVGAADSVSATDGTSVRYRTVMVQSSAINEGTLVLVNYNYAYDRIDEVELTNAYNERTGKIKVSSTTLGMEPEAFAALEQLVAGLVDDTGCDDLLLYSGHRTLADQQRIWDSNMASYGEEYTKTYVAVPGHSEHHTGYACDLGFYTDDGLSIPLVDHEYGTWVWEHCTEYGYILRYPAEKADITGIGHEQWHFRYVGLPHAYAVDRLDFCYEEYVDYLRGYTADTKLLHISADREVGDVTVEELSSVSGGWLTYFVPASEGAETEIRIPEGERYGSYEISGNNVDGFIVTIALD